MSGMRIAEEGGAEEEEEADEAIAAGEGAVDSAAEDMLRTSRMFLQRRTSPLCLAQLDLQLRKTPQVRRPQRSRLPNPDRSARIR